MIGIAAAKWPIQAPDSFEAYAARQTAALTAAAAAGAHIAVLPEYLSLELAGLFPAPVREDFHHSLQALQALRGDWCRLYGRLARELNLYIAAGSFLLDAGHGRYRNRADWFLPDGRQQWQDKLHLTAFEREQRVIEPGDSLHRLDGPAGPVGLLVCYDSEFPLLARRLHEHGVRLFLVPSCTDTAAGATRVRVGCLARALENRSHVAQAVTAGEADWSPALDRNTGEAAVIAPMDRGFPANGLLAETGGEALWAQAEIDPEALETHRETAQVRVDRDWPLQDRPGIRAVLDAPAQPPTDD